MLLTVFDFFEHIEDSLWGYLGFPAILAVGCYLTYKSRLVQLRKFPQVMQIFFSFLLNKDKSSTTPAVGIHPLKVFFACVGGCVGIGNIVGITTAVQLGGPGAIFWVWITAIVGSLVKYSEVYLGMRHRVKVEGGFLGGPMYFLKKAFSGSWASKLFCVLMCLYGVEIYQFSVMTSSVSQNLGFPKVYVALVFLALVIAAERGGMKRIGSICSTIIPLFIFLYLGMGGYVLASCASAIPQVFADIFHYAFTPHAAVGAFAGSTIMLSLSQGIRRACYSCDVGVGYASIVHSESSVQNSARQASLTIFEVFLDIFVICTMSVVIVLATGVWTQDIDATYLVQSALSQFFPYMNFFIPFFLVLLGYSTIITYFGSGMKTALYLSPKYGRKIYYSYAIVALFLFSFVDTTDANTVMMCVLALLLALNLAAIWRLRREIRFDITPEVQVADEVQMAPQVVLAE